MSDAFSSNTEWTVLLYIGAVANDQEDCDEALLGSLQGLALSSKVRFVYQIATESGTRRGTIAGGQLKETDRSPVINIATPEPLTDFIDWGTAKFPSRYTALFLKDHGTGFEDPPPPDPLVPSRPPSKGEAFHAMFYDGETGRFLPTRNLRTAVAKSRLGSVDVYGFDACSMAGVEVAYEVRDVAQYIVGSESTEVAIGWPYRGLLERLSALEGALHPRDLAIELAQMANVHKTFSLSVAATSFLEPLAASLDTLGRALFRAWSPDAEAALTDVRRLGDPDYVDLGSLLHLIGNATELPPEVRTEAASVRKELHEACLTKAREDKNRQVLSIFYPPATGSEYIPAYGSFAFGSKSAWTLFLGVRFYWLLYEPVS